MAFRTKSKDREEQRLRRHRRVRRTIVGTLERPRLVVHRSSKNMQGHLADDVEGRILLGVSTLSQELRGAAASLEETARPVEATQPAAAEPPAAETAEAAAKAEKKAGKQQGKKSGEDGKKSVADGKKTAGDGKKSAGAGKKAARDGKKTALSRAAGKLLAEKANAVGITRVVFDRGGYLYHGRVAAFAEGAREGGLEF